MEELRQSKHLNQAKHALTPSSRKKDIISTSSKQKSPEKRLKKTKDLADRRPSNSTNKALSLSLTRNNPSNPGSKSNTPKNSTVNKSVNHRRFLSTIERPTSSSNSKKDPKKPTQRKFSLDPSYSTPVVCKFSYETKTGFIPGNTQKTNQDSYFAHINFANQPDMYLFGVCDGHGFYGGEVSGFIKQRLPSLLTEHPEILSNPKKALSVCIHKCNQELGQINLDVKFSGSTLIVVLIRGNIVYCANVGDSRALLARQIVESAEQATSKKWMSIALSRDHKPDNKEESERIYKNGGRVEAYQDENGNPAGPARVWLKSQDLPGLAMSRSLGDAVAASVGVICDPEILELKLVPEDKFILIGSDGVFEFITNEELVKVTVPYFRILDCEGTCETIVKEATRRWKNEEEVIDDITILCIFLDIPNRQ